MSLSGEMREQQYANEVSKENAYISATIDSTGMSKVSNERSK